MLIPIQLKQCIYNIKYSTFEEEQIIRPTAFCNLNVILKPQNEDIS